MPQEQWRCSQAHSLTLGLPASLKEVARCLKLSQQKMDEGKALIRYFSMPCRPTKANGGRTRNLPCHDRGKWETFKTYCKQDVVVERSIRKRLENYPMTDKELKLWYLDQKINDFGVKVDTTLVKNAIQCDEIYQKELMNEATELTGLENPNSPTQLKGWLKDNYNLEVKSLSKTKVAELLDEIDNPTVKRVLGLRQEMSKTSVRKYEAMDRAMGKDERIRGLLQFYGASTGRWCLAENTPVLVKTTDGVIAEKPIQNVSIKDMLWDGENWVNHSGVVFSGDKEVIAWDGVTATPEHIVYLSNKEKMTLREAKERGQLLWRGNTPFTN
jgi:DNA polymerase